METLKRIIIKEELVAITGDFIKAVILQQLLYWTDRMKDIDKYLEQENKRLTNHGYPETDCSSLCPQGHIAIWKGHPEVPA